MAKDIVCLFAATIFLITCLRCCRIKSFLWLQYLLLTICVSISWWAFSNQIALLIGSSLLILFYVIPNILAKVNYRLVYQEKYRQTAYIASLIGFLLPLSDFRLAAKYYKGIDLLKNNNQEKGQSILQEVISAGQPFSRLAELCWRNMNCDYDWIIQEVGIKDIEKYPQALEFKIRAFGETGQLDLLVDECFLHKEILSRQEKSDLSQTMMIVAAYSGNTTLWQIFSSKAFKYINNYSKCLWEATYNYTSSGDKQAYLESLEILSDIVPTLYKKSFTYRLSQTKISHPIDLSSEHGSKQLKALEEYFNRFKKFTIIDEKEFPWITVLLLLGYIIVYLLATISKLPALKSYFEHGALIYPYSLANGEWWRFISASFIHGNLIHLVVNFLFILVYFPILEKLLGHLRFLMIYLASGIGAFLLSFLLLSKFHLIDYPIIILGASGAISGIIGYATGIALKTWQGIGLSLNKKIRVTISMLIMIVCGQILYNILFFQEYIWIHLSGYFIGVTLFLSTDRTLTEPALTKSKRVLLAILSWVLFLLIALLKIPYDLHHKKTVNSNLSYIAGYISEFSSEPQAATKWYLISAEKGDVDAQATVAYRYEVGEGIQKNPQKAVYWLKKAAKRNNLWAQTNLARVNFYGIGTTTNLSESYYWYLRTLKNPAFEQSEQKMSIPSIARYVKSKLSPEQIQQVNARLEKENQH